MKRDHAPRSRPSRHRRWTWLCCLSIFLTQGLARAAEDRAGEKIYQEKCISCHGAKGEGSKEYPHPLVGDRSVGQLARLIAKTMPEDDPGTCVGEDAQKVAAYIHEAFYSRTAQARIKPLRIELARLTVRQYRNAIADLIGSFRSQGRWDDKRGLSGEYFNGRGFRYNRRLKERTDPAIDFKFGTAAPLVENPATATWVQAGAGWVPLEFLKYGTGREFGIRWQGSILAPETGEYEFIVKTENSARLFINDARKPLVDAWVKSGNDTEYRGSIYLLGGRVYPLRLEFSKSKEGVDDSKTNKAKKKPTSASVALGWKLPKRAEEIIPERNLSPNRFPETLVVSTPFPPDDRSVGYERGTSISKAWDLATTDTAIDVATYVVQRLGEFTGTSETSPDRLKKTGEFCHAFAERAFRRPLTAEQKDRLVDRYLRDSKDLEKSVKLVVLRILKSPRFLYREIGGGGADGFDVASRLSFGLWDSIPDPPLREAAAAGKLATREQVASQAERMLGDLKARSKVREFLLQWLRVDQIPEITKDGKLFPKFDAPLASDLRTSLDLFLQDVVWNNEGSDFRELLQGNTTYLNGRLARFYGVGLPADAPFQKVSWEPRERAGVLSHPYLMASFAYNATTSPIHRGVFLSRGILGRTLRPPPEAVAPLAPDLHAGLTTRERVTLQTSPKACLMCHTMINPLGFALENFDAVGRYRSEEKGKPIDATGTYQTRAGETVSFNGVRDLARFMSGSEETHTAFVEQLFHYLVKQPIRAYGPQQTAELRKSFVEHKFNIRKLLVDIMASSALTAPNAVALQSPTTPIPVAAGK